MSRLFLGIFAFAFSTAALAQAGTDCKAKSDEGVQTCSDGLTKAEEAALAGGLSGIPNAGNTLAAGAMAAKATIGKAMDSCISDDLNTTCLNSCNEALSDAQSKEKSAQDPTTKAKFTALVKSTKDNMNSCGDQINNRLATSKKKQDGYDQIAAAGNNSANSGCAEGETCGARDPNVVEADSPCGAGMFFSQRFNQCTGIQAFKPCDMIYTRYCK